MRWRLLAFALLFGLWLLLVDTFDVAEVLSGAVVAATATEIGGAACRRDLSRPRGRQLTGSLVALPVAVAADTWRVLVATLLHMLRVRRTQGSFQAEAERVGGNSRGDAVRRAALAWRTSLPPTAFVLGFDRDRQSMVVHRFAARRKRDA